MMIYRIFNAVTDGGDDLPVPVQHVEKHEELNDYSVAEDTTHLLLNYRDPFGLVKQPDTVVKRTTRVVAAEKAPPTPKPTFSWNFVKYSGYTRSAGSNKLLAVMSINGQSALLQEGETAGEVKLLKNYQDSIKVAFKGRTGYIKMQ